MKKILAILLVIMMLITAAPVASAYYDDYRTEGSWTYYVWENDDGETVAEISDCSEDLSGTVTIPATLGGYKVVSIDSSVFYYCDNITAFKVANGQNKFKVIDGVLYGKSTYYDEETEKDIETLYLAAYPNGKKDKTYSIPEGVSEVYRFGNVSYIETINIPSTLGNANFRYLNNLKEINVSTINKEYYSIDGVLFQKYNTEDENGNETNQKILIQYPCKKEGTSYSVPSETTAIGHYAFYNCEGLEKIVIPNSVKEIGGEAFSGCYNLAELFLPESITDISADAIRDTALYKNEKNWTDGAFYLSNILLAVDQEKIGESITVKSGTKVIASKAFSSCSGLKKIILPDSVKKIGHEAFAWCDNLTDIELGGGLTEIGDYAFRGCVSIKKINIPDTVTKIGYDAFSGCILLNSVKMSNNVKEIGDEAFYNCTSLQSISLPSTLTSLGYGTFYNCTMLEEITLPAGIEGIRASTFEGTAAYDNGWEDGILYISGYVVDSNPEKVNGDIAIKNGTTDICYYAFYDCDNMKSVSIPNSVVNINERAFYDCNGLKTVELNNVVSIESEAFYDCYNLESCTFGNKTKKIEDRAFAYTNLTTVTIPASVEKIGENVFLYNFSLKEITVDSNNSTYSSLDGVLYNKAKTELIKYPENKDTEIFSIPETVKTIKDYAFYGADFSAISIPASVKEYEGTAFEDCGWLKEINVDSSNVVYSSDNGVFYNKDKSELIKIPQSMEAETYTIASTVKTIREYAGIYCSDIQNLIMSKNVENIGYKAFYNCNSLKTVELNNVVSIESEAFENCYNLESCTFGNKTKKIGDMAFAYTKLTKVTIPASVEKIGDGAFHDCDKMVAFSVSTANKNYTSKDGVLYSKNFDVLIQYPASKEGTTFTVPDTVISIQDCAFYYAKNLKEITLNNGLKNIGSSAFYGNEKLTQMIIHDSVESIGSHAFANCISLKTITIGKGLQGIGSDCFYNCSSLESIVIPDSVTYIGGWAFEECTSLKSVKLSSNLSSIGDSCFEDCKALTEITIPDNVEYIGDEAFMGCTSLKTVNLGKNVKYIYSDAFCNCAFDEITLSYNIENIGSGAFGYIYNEETWDREKKPNFKIYCYDESEGMDYAVENGFDYEILPDDENRPPRRTLSDEETGVEIKYNNEFESGTELNVEREYDGTSFTIIGKEFGEVSSAVYDINAYKDGEKVQPNGKVTVRIPIPDGFDASRLAVCYVNAETKQVTKLPMEIIDGYVVFQTDHFSYYAIIELSDSPTGVNSVSISDITLNYKKSAKINPKIDAEKGTEYSVSYTSSNPKVATVDNNGKVYAAKKGNATITCTVTDSNGNTVSDTCKVTVKYSFGQWLIKILLFGWIWY